MLRSNGNQQKNYKKGLAEKLSTLFYGGHLIFF